MEALPPEVVERFACFSRKKIAMKYFIHLSLQTVWITHENDVKIFLIKQLPTNYTQLCIYTVDILKLRNDRHGRKISAIIQWQTAQLFRPSGSHRCSEVHTALMRPNKEII